MAIPFGADEKQSNELVANQHAVPSGSDNAGRPSSSSSSSSSTTQEPETAFHHQTAGTDVEKQSVQEPQPTLTQILSRTISRASHLTEPGPPPDGGWKAWSQALGGHLVIFNTWGYVNSYGVFQNYYTQALNQTPSAIAWVGSIQIFLVFFIGTFSGRLTDGGYFRLIFTIGTILEVLGVFLTSICTQYWQLFLTHGILTGIGMGCLFCPTIALMPTYFTKKRNFAIGLTASGSATGGMIFPAIAQQLLPKAGFGWTVRAIGFVVLFTQIVAWCVLRPRLPPRKTGPLVEWGAFKEPQYLSFAVAMFLIFWGLYPGFFYIGPFAQDILGLPRSESIILLVIVNAVGLPSRLIPAYIADRYTGPINLLIFAAAISGLVVYGWIGVHDRAGIYVFACFYGIFASAIQSLFPACTSSLTTDVKKMGVRMGMVFSTVSFACLTGSPIAGALITKNNGNYLYEQVYTGTILLVGGLILVFTRVAVTGPKLIAKA